MPRAATSVATSTGRVPSRNAPRTRFRTPWLRPPCSAAARTPCSRSCWATRSAPSLVRTKTTVRPGRFATSAVMTFLCCGSTRSTWWAIVVIEACAVVGRVGDGVGEVPLDQPVDAPVEGRREEQPLAALGEQVEDRRDLRQEPHLGHVVGLVEDGDLDVAELDGAALDEVVQTARRGDEEVDTTVEGGDLGGVAEAAGDELVAQAHDVHERLQRVGHLHGQLAGGHEDQGSRTTRGGARCVVGEAGDGREAEGQRLAGAGPAASEHVAAGEAVGDRGGLDRERLGDAVASQSLDEPLGQAECGERVVGRDIDRAGAHRATGGLGPRVGGDPLGLGVDAARRVTGDVAAGRVRLVCGAIVVRRDGGARRRGRSPRDRAGRA